MNKRGSIVAIAALCGACASSPPPAVITPGSHLPIADFEAGSVAINEVTLTYSADLKGKYQKAHLRLSGQVEMRPTEPVTRAEPMLTIERCVMDDGTDITNFQEQQAPGQIARRNRNSDSFWRADQYAASSANVTANLVNIPPHSYATIRELRGYATLTLPRGTETGRVAFQEDATSTSPAGWTLRLAGVAVPSGGQGYPKARLTIARGDLTSDYPGDNDAPKLIRIEALDALGSVVADGAANDARAMPGGLAVDISFNIHRRSQEEIKIETVRIEYITQTEQVRIPFEYRDVRLTR